MDKKVKLIDNILKDFLAGERAAADNRIMSIRHFLSALDSAVSKHIIEGEHIKEDEKKRLVNMIDDMADIYKHEISDLLVKKGKLQHYLNIFKQKDTIQDKIETNKALDNSYLN